MKTKYRRRLPHIQPTHGTFFVTFRLHNSIPVSVIQRLKREHEEAVRNIKEQIDDEETVKDLITRGQKKYFGKLDAYLDNGPTGPHWLLDPKIAETVCEAIHYRDQDIYDLIAFCIMSNHVHLVFSQLDQSLTLARIMKSLKRFTSRAANKILDRTGKAFWQSESYDHLVRDERELTRITDYVLQNPVKAGLVDRWENWPYCYLKAAG